LGVTVSAIKESQPNLIKKTKKTDKSDEPDKTYFDYYAHAIRSSELLDKTILSINGSSVAVALALKQIYGIKNPTDIMNISFSILSFMLSVIILMFGHVINIYDSSYLAQVNEDRRSKFKRCFMRGFIQFAVWASLFLIAVGYVFITITII
jgi:hypothetical protein